MGKKNPFVITIGFNKHDPAHVEVAQFLNGMERGKAQYIVNAVLAYQNEVETAGISIGQEVDYEKIRQFVLQVIKEYQGQEMPNEDIVGEWAKADATKKREGDAFGFDEDALNGIMLSLEAFKG
jgi:hypothetical protein